MRILKDESLAPKTTFKVGGIATNYYIPESTEDVRRLTKELHGEEYYILSGGSNLLINDKKHFKHVISCAAMDHDLVDNGDGHFYIGASNRIQDVITFVNGCGYGGFEELVSLPAMFGGIIYMNAGIGGGKNALFCIGDFIDHVRCVRRSDGEVVWMDRKECRFAPRSSVFQDNRFIIMGADITLQPQEKEVSEERIRKRKEHCRQTQKWGKGCFGSCFSRCDGRALSIWYKLFGRKRRGVMIDSNNKNWLINNGNATFAETEKLIEKAVLIHRVLRKDIETEVVIWK